MKNLVRKNRIFYARVTHNGRDMWRSLETSVESVAKGKLRAMIDSMRGVEGATAAHRQLKGSTATVNDVVTAYREAAKARYLATGKPRPDTVDGYCWALFHVVKRGAGVEDPAKAPAALLTAKLAQDFVAAIMGDGGDETRARTSAAGILRNARAVFARWARPSFERLRLPDTSGFLQFSCPTPRHKYQLPPAPLRDATEKAAAVLAVDNPKLYAAYLLCRFAGLRAGECVAARWDWLAPGMAGGVAVTFLNVANGHGFKTKNGRERQIPLSAHVVESLRAVQTDDGNPYILGGDSDWSRQKIVERQLADWLRSVGWHGDKYPKAAHEMRKLFGADCYTIHGAEIAAKWLGDTLQTAWAYYCDLTRVPAPLEVRKLA